MFSNVSFEGKTTEERLHLLPPPGITPELIPQLFKNLSPEQVDMLATIPPQVGGMFPNVLVLFIFAPRTDGGSSGALALHTYIPRGPDHFEFVNYMLQNSIQQAGTSGIIEQDDADTWPQIMRNTKGPMSRSITLKYQALHGHEKPEGWPGGGLLYPGFTKDDTQWNWWLNYHRLMSAS
jgi:hypothetical protein